MFNKTSAFMLETNGSLVPVFLLGDGSKYTSVVYPNGSLVFPDNSLFRFHVCSDGVLLLQGSGVNNTVSQINIGVDYPYPVGSFYLSVHAQLFQFSSYDDILNYLDSIFNPLDFSFYYNNSVTALHIVSVLPNSVEWGGYRVIPFTLPTCCPLDYSPIIQLLGGQ